MDTSWIIPLVGDVIEIVIYDYAPEEIAHLRNMCENEARRLQKIFNLYDPQSELSILNASRHLSVSPELLEVLQMALIYCAKTSGKYDVTKGKEFLARKRGKNTQTACTYENVLIQGNDVQLTHDDCMIDLGSIAKGYIGDKLLDFLTAQGMPDGFVDMRGDMAIRGRHLEVINVQHPRGGTICPFILERGAVATSGGYRQYVDTPANSHLVGSNDMCSITILAPTLMEADVLATAIFVTGLENIERILPNYAKALVITNDAEMMFNDFHTHLLEKQHET